jgi:hypothetical protein
MKFTRVLNTQLPYLFGGEIDYLEELSDYLDDGASVVFLGFVFIKQVGSSVIYRRI